MKIYYLSRFIRAYRKLSIEIKGKVYEVEEIFRKDPFDPRLKTHKLSGGLKGKLAFSVDYQTRIIFRFDEKNAQIVYFESIGDHSLYSKI